MPILSIHIDIYVADIPLHMAITNVVTSHQHHNVFRSFRDNNVSTLLSD